GRSQSPDARRPPMTFRITGLPADRFTHLYNMDDARLRELHIERRRVDANPGFPDRVSLRDAEVGESVLLLNYMHHAADTPYRASHAIFVIEGESRPCDVVD